MAANVKVSVDKGKIVLEIDPTASLGPSRSGKTILVATTAGNVPVDVNGTTVFVGVNAFKYPQPRVQPGQ